MVFWTALPIPPAATPSASLALLDRTFVTWTLAGMLW
jgi:hypothetical protein